MEGGPESSVGPQEAHGRWVSVMIRDGTGLRKMRHKKLHSSPDLLLRNHSKIPEFCAATTVMVDSRNSTSILEPALVGGTSAQFSRRNGNGYPNIRLQKEEYKTTSNHRFKKVRLKAQGQLADGGIYPLNEG